MILLGVGIGLLIGGYMKKRKDVMIAGGVCLGLGVLFTIIANV